MSADEATGGWGLRGPRKLTIVAVRATVRPKALMQSSQVEVGRWPARVVEIDEQF
jgi:hypothetical protein